MRVRGAPTPVPAAAAPSAPTSESVRSHVGRGDRAGVAPVPRPCRRRPEFTPARYGCPTRNRYRPDQPSSTARLLCPAGRTSSLDRVEMPEVRGALTPSRLGRNRRRRQDTASGPRGCRDGRWVGTSVAHRLSIPAPPVKPPSAGPTDRTTRPFPNRHPAAIDPRHETHVWSGTRRPPARPRRERPQRRNCAVRDWGRRWRARRSGVAKSTVGARCPAWDRHGAPVRAGEGGSRMQHPTPSPPPSESATGRQAVGRCVRGGDSGRRCGRPSRPVSV